MDVDITLQNFLLVWSFQVLVFPFESLYSRDPTLNSVAAHIFFAMIKEIRDFEKFGFIQAFKKYVPYLKIWSISTHTFCSISVAYILGFQTSYFKGSKSMFSQSSD